MPGRNLVKTGLEGGTVRSTLTTVNAGSGAADVLAVAAPAAGRFFHITDIIIGENGAACTTSAYLLNIKSGSTTVMSFPFVITTPITGTISVHLNPQCGIRCAAATAVNVAVTTALTAGDFRIAIIGYDDKE